MTDSQDVTALLTALSAGQTEALDELMPIIYENLRLIARRHLRQERADHTMSTTDLVHEAYLKLVNVEQVEWRDRAHFFAMASRAMRRILIDYARSRTRAKRGGQRKRVSLENAFEVAEESPEDLLALEDALQRLEALNERHCRVVEYRFFGGLSIKETAEALGVSVASVKRDWAVTRAWLNRELGDVPKALE